MANAKRYRFLIGTTAIVAACAGGISFAAAAPAAGSLPMKVGQCVTTRVKEVGTRSGVPVATALKRMAADMDGSWVTFTNGGYQVSYDNVAAVLRSKRGDSVRMCLVSIPKGCPPGDNRGRFYKTTNLRLGASWRLPDSQHMCGGA